MKTLLIALAVLTAPTDSLPDLSHPWSLQECIDWAMDNNLTVAGSQLTVETRTIDNNTARMAWLPAVSGSVGENFSFGRGIGGNNTYEKGNSSSTSFSVGASMNLFDGLATPRRMQLAKLNLEAATADLEKARDDVSVKVAQAYVQILYNYEIHDVAARQVSIDSLQVERLQGLFDTGRASAAEVSQQKATLAQSRVTLIQASNNIRSSLLDLAQLLELPYWEGFSVVRPKVTFSSLVIPHPDEIYAEALDIRPAIRAEKLRLEGAKKQIQIAKASYYPSLSLGGGVGTNYYTSFATQGFRSSTGRRNSICSVPSTPCIRRSSRRGTAPWPPRQNTPPPWTPPLPLRTPSRSPKPSTRTARPPSPSSTNPWPAWSRPSQTPSRPPTSACTRPPW